MHVGKLLKSVRLKAKLTQLQLADSLQFGAQYISNIERGMSSLSPVYFESVCFICSVKIEVFFKAAEKDFSEKLRRI